MTDRPTTTTPPKTTILHVDDDEANRYAVTRSLVKAGFAVTEAATGHQALAKVAQRPDLVVLDVRLPDISGFEVCRRIKSDPATAGIPVLHLSASLTSGEDKAFGLDSGAEGYLIRPVEPVELVATIKALLRTKAIEDVLRKRNARLAMLSDAAAELLATTDPDQMLPQVFDRVRQTLQLDVFFNFMVDDTGRRLELAAFGGVDAATAQAIGRLDFGQIICGTVALQRQRVVLEDLQHSAGYVVDGDDKATGVRAMGIRCYACHPLMVGDRLIGTLSFGSRSRDKFDPDELGFMQTIAHYVALARERTRGERERVRLLEREQAARVEAEAANRAKDRFLAVLSHELRTPLTPVMIAATSMDADPDLPPQFRDDLATIQRNVDLENRLIDDLLDLSRVMNGKLRTELKPVRAHELIGHVFDMVREELTEKRLVVTKDLAAPEDLILGDAARLQQVLWNLLKNAAKFTPEGGAVTVTTRVIPLSRDPKGEPQPSPQGSATAPAPGTLEIEVRDTGRGITREALARIFDAFEQGELGITREFGGLGLGLSIAKAVVELHRGTITAASDGTGKGAAFTVRLPLTRAAAPAPRREGPAGPAPTSAGGGAPVRVLVVEDHADTARMLARVLARLGFDVATAGNVATALDTADTRPFDIVVSDIGLPDATGYDLMRQIRQRAATAATAPIRGIAMSGFGMEDDLRRSREAGFDEHLIKPVSVRDLEQAIRRVAERTRE